jgi:hypothetical protein
LELVERAGVAEGALTKGVVGYAQDVEMEGSRRWGMRFCGRWGSGKSEHNGKTGEAKGWVLWVCWSAWAGINTGLTGFVV